MGQDSNQRGRPLSRNLIISPIISLVPWLNLGVGTKPRIAFVHNLLIHYRVPVFNLLSKSKEFRFDFYFAAIHPGMRGKERTEQYKPTFAYVVLNALQLGGDRFVSPSLLWHLLRSYDLYVSGPLASPDCWITFLAAKLRKRPFILWDERWTPTRSLLSQLVQPFQLLIAKKSDSVIVPGSRSFNYFSGVLGDTKALSVVPNASTLTAPTPRQVHDFREQNRIPSDAKVVLYVGRLLALKGLEFLLQGFSELESNLKDEAFLLIAGDGEYREHLEEISKRLDIRNLVFIGHVDDQATCLGAGDVVVLPSVSTREISEIWGMVVNEAASLGKPVVVTEAVGCADDLVRRFECGYVVREQDADAIHLAIQKILSDRKLALTMGANGIKATKSAFSFETMADGFCEAIRKTLSSSKGRA